MASLPLSLLLSLSPLSLLISLSLSLSLSLSRPDPVPFSSFVWKPILFSFCPCLSFIQQATNFKVCLGVDSISFFAGRGKIFSKRYYLVDFLPNLCHDGRVRLNLSTTRGHPQLAANSRAVEWKTLSLSVSLSFSHSLSLAFFLSFFLSLSFSFFLSFFLLLSLSLSSSCSLIHFILFSRALSLSLSGSLILSMLFVNSIRQSQASLSVLTIFRVPLYLVCFPFQLKVCVWMRKKERER